MDKVKGNYPPIIRILPALLLVSWLVLALLDSLVFGSVSAFMNISYILFLAIVALSVRLYLEK